MVAALIPVEGILAIFVRAGGAGLAFVAVVFASREITREDLRLALQTARPGRRSKK